MEERKFCTWSNPCGKTVCCAFCSKAKCAERCKDDKLTCKYATAQERANLSVKTATPSKPLKPWDKDKIKV